MFKQGLFSIKSWVRLLALLIIPGTIWYCSGSAGQGLNPSGSDASGDDPLAGTEGSLFEDGPIDIPITIAKLNHIDASKVGVTVEVGSGGSCLARFAITGAAGAVLDPEANPKVFAYNSNRDTSATGDIAADGSFSVKVCGTASDTIVLAAMNDAEDAIGPPLLIEVDDTGNVVISDTNTDNLFTTANLVVDDDGNTYLLTSGGAGAALVKGVVKQATGEGCDLLKQRADNLEYETVFEDSSDCPIALDAREGIIIAYINEGGELKVMRKDTETDQWGSPTVIGTIPTNDTEAFQVTMAGYQFALQVLGADPAFGILARSVDEESNFLGATELGYLTEFIWASGDAEPTVTSDLVPIDSDDEAKYIFDRYNQETNSLNRYQIRVANACGGFETCAGSVCEDLEEGEVVDGVGPMVLSVLTMDESFSSEDSGLSLELCSLHLHGVSYMAVSKDRVNDNYGRVILTNGTLGIYKFDPGEDSDAIQIDTSKFADGEFQYTKISDDGSMIVTCAYENADDAVYHLYAAFFDQEAANFGDFTALTSGDVAACSEGAAGGGSFIIDPNNNIHFYRDGQHSVIFDPGPPSS